MLSFFLFLLISRFNLWCLDKIHGAISVFCNGLRHAFCWSMWWILEKVQWGADRVYLFMCSDPSTPSACCFSLHISFYHFDLESLEFLVSFLSGSYIFSAFSSVGVWIKIFINICLVHLVLVEVISSISLFSLILDDLSIYESEILKCPTISVIRLVC